MSETNDAPSGSAVALDDDDWLTATPEESLSAGEEKPPPSSRRQLAIRAGLIAAGAVVGGVVVTSISHGGSTTTANGVPSAAVGAQGGGQFPGNGQAPTFGGLNGEERLSGSLVSVGASTVTIKTSTGTASYDVTSSSEIVRNGQVVALSALRPGDTVFVHVYPAGSGSQMTVERLFATSN